MRGALLDTHALFWFVSGKEQLSDEAMATIGTCQIAQNLFVSPISAWELAVASLKRRVSDRPHLGTDTPDRWFEAAMSVARARLVPIEARIAVEAADVVAQTGHRDPGDCFLIATARVQGVAIITRDAVICEIAGDLEGYLQVILC